MIIRDQIVLDYLLTKMLEKGIINDREKRQINDKRCGEPEDRRIDDLLHILNQTVQMDGDIFTWFIEVLRDYKTKRMTILADKLQREYEEKLTYMYN